MLCQSVKLQYSNTVHVVLCVKVAGPLTEDAIQHHFALMQTPKVTQVKEIFLIAIWEWMIND